MVLFIPLLVPKYSEQSIIQFILHIDNPTILVCIKIVVLQTLRNTS